MACQMSWQSSQEDTDQNITTLPSDVIRNILRVGVEPIDEMRLISRRWNALAMEHLANRKLLPAISTLYWFFGENGEMQMKVRIPENLKKYIGVRGTTEEDGYIVLASGYLSDELLKNITKTLIRLLSRCSCIARLEIELFPVREIGMAAKRIRDILATVTIDELCLIRMESFHVNHLQEVLHLLMLPNIKSLTLQSNNAWIFAIEAIESEYMDFFAQAVLVVSEVKVTAPSIISACEEIDMQSMLEQVVIKLSNQFSTRFTNDPSGSTSSIHITRRGDIHSM